MPPTPDDGATGDGGSSEPDVVQPGSSIPVTLSFSLIDTVQNEVIETFTGGWLADGQSLSVVASDTVGSIGFFLNGTLIQLENRAPYALFGDESGNYYTGDLPEGEYTLTARAYSGQDGEGDIIGQETVPLEIAQAVAEPSASDQTDQPETGDTTTPETPTEPETDDQTTTTPTEEPTIVLSGTTSPSSTPQTGSQDDGGDTTPTTISSDVSVYAGRVTTLSAEGDDIASVRIIDPVDHGKITVNPDNTMALVMTRSDFVGNQSFSYEVTHADGSTSVHQVGLNVEEGLQEKGWATGENHYMLATDANDNIIVETGEFHTKVYVTASNSALSLADVAQLEGVNVSQVTGQFLADNGYGQSEDLALDQQAGIMLWNTVTPFGSDTSNWFLMERGYQYDEINSIIVGDQSGEDELHPLYIGAWGEGDRPELTQSFSLQTDLDDPTSNVVIQGVHFSGGMDIKRVDNFIMDDSISSGPGAGMNRMDGVTVRNSQFLDAHVDSPIFDDWSTSDRASGLFIAYESDGVLLEGLTFDMNGWVQGYEDGSVMPPTQYNHNLYIQVGVEDITMRDSFIMRGSAMGAKIRPGAFVEDNVFIDNNVSLSVQGGDYKGAGNVGYYSFLQDNVVTSAGHKYWDNTGGALATGTHDLGALTTYIDNIVTHLADPNGDEDYKIVANGATSQQEAAYYDDTVIYNWKAYDHPDGYGNYTSSGEERIPNTNIEGLDTDILDQTTIQVLAAQLLNQDTATIDDFANILRDQFANQVDDAIDADMVIRWFQENFGIAPDIRTESADITFVPSDLGEGIRWDNRVNWDSNDLPGQNPGDNVDLNGNDVVFGTNAEINTLDLGSEGWLNIYGGRLDVNGGLEGDNAELNIEGAGQIWVEGSGTGGSDVDITASSGRFVNTGDMTGTDLDVSGAADAILATDNGWYEVGNGHTLSIAGGADVGFDDNDGDYGILDFDAGSTLQLSVENGELGAIAEFRSGAFGEDGPNVMSGIDLGNTALQIDLSGLSADAGSTLALMSADELVGIFDTPEIGGLGARNANIVIDYVNDTVTLQLSSGNGQVSVEAVGQQSDVSSGAEELWNLLTADQGVISEQTSASPDQEDLLVDAA